METSAQDTVVDDAGTADAEASPRRRGHHTVAIIAAVVGVVGIVLVVLLATRPAALDVQARTPLLGKPAPPLVGPDVTGGPPFRLSAQQGKWVLVNYFATWCVPCRKEHPEFVRFWQRRGDDVAVVMVIYNDDVSKVRQWFAANGGGWPVVPDPGGQTALDFGVRGIPETFVVDPAGVIVAKFVGAVSADGLDQALAQAGRP